MATHYARVALVVLCIGLFAAAQETMSNNNSARPPAANKVVNTASPYGRVNYLPLWTNANFIENSAIFQSGGKVVVGKGDFSITSGNLDLPLTTGSTVGVINIGGAPFLHNYGITSQNTFVGKNAGNFFSTGINNSGAGFETLFADTSGSNNTAQGVFALSANTTGNYNTAIGSVALQSNIGGSGNTAAGYLALNLNSTGGQNTANGLGTLSSNSTGSSNTALGYAALSSNTTGGSNVAVGLNALSPNTVGQSNVAVGDEAGTGPSVITGFGNTFIGSNSGPGTESNLNNAAAIGLNATVTSSNALVLGGTGVYAVNVGIGLTAPAHTIDTATGAYLSNAGVWTNASDRNIKKNFRPLSGPDVLRGLNAMVIQTWSYKKEPESIRHVGPMAQDFFAAFGLGEDDKHISTIDSEGIALVAIQELYRLDLQKDAEIKKLTAEVTELRALRKELAAIQARQALGARPALNASERSVSKIRKVKASAALTHQ